MIRICHVISGLQFLHWHSDVLGKGGAHLLNCRKCIYHLVLFSIWSMETIKKLKSDHVWNFNRLIKAVFMQHVFLCLILWSLTASIKYPASSSWFTPEKKKFSKAKLLPYTREEWFILKDKDLVPHAREAWLLSRNCVCSSPQGQTILSCHKVEIRSLIHFICLMYTDQNWSSWSAVNSELLSFFLFFWGGRGGFFQICLFGCAHLVRKQRYKESIFFF